MPVAAPADLMNGIYVHVLCRWNVRAADMRTYMKLHYVCTPRRANLGVSARTLLYGDLGMLGYDIGLRSCEYYGNLQSMFEL